MKSGVNKHGVRWIQEGNKTTAFYQLASDIELSKTFENATKQKIERLTGTELLKNERAKK
jgi:hypothetical protein